MEMQTAITLLTIIVILLSVVISTVIVTAVIVLVKVNKLVKNANQITDNVVAATAWLSPAKVFAEAARLFKRK